MKGQLLPAIRSWMNYVKGILAVKGGRSRRYGKGEELFFVSELRGDAPEVDGEVLVTNNRKLEIGNYYQVRITGSEDFDLYGDVNE